MIRYLIKSQRVSIKESIEAHGLIDGLKKAQKEYEERLENYESYGLGSLDLYKIEIKKIKNKNNIKPTRRES